MPLLRGAACTADGNGITYNEHINVALAVAMPDGGLITPVIKDADVTDIYQVGLTVAFAGMHTKSASGNPALSSTMLCNSIAYNEHVDVALAMAIPMAALSRLSSRMLMSSTSTRWALVGR